MKRFAVLVVLVGVSVVGIVGCGGGGGGETRGGSSPPFGTMFD